MASTSFSVIFKKSRNLTATFLLCRPYCSTSTVTHRKNLFSRISPLGDPSISISPILDNWIQEGNPLDSQQLYKIIKTLRTSKRFNQALRVSEWMSRKGLCPISATDHAVQLNLIGKVRGLESVESYFQNLSDEHKTEKAYGALLNCYVREGLVDKSLSLMQTMKDLGFVSVLNFNNIMCLYLQTQHYRICINSFGASSDLIAMEKLLEEMERQSHIRSDWITYSIVANHYIKADMKEKALIYLNKCEDKADKRSLVKLGDLDEAEKLLVEWDLSGNFYDFRVPNILLIGYSKNGMIEKAETMLRSMVEKGKNLIPNSWAIVAAGYVDKENMEKAYQCMKEAMALQA
ncbi:pentatricopeptide repeat-containing protein mitochondrial-like [Trifolium pratense]|uniref:Pentatricopeptide repeat-containing protein mitochondrial-like n=1 Tax=Trifolium pratense TaxID=57577 RepID=A0A2K3PJ04_TRIPR|nr:pentatricopeptide repeat-containing protein mitochondrial-like [Trifolium pratense]